MATGEFQPLLRQRGEELYRDMPWRADTRPYYILVSELMLQQTQVDRVIPRFLTFIDAFPNEEALAAASLAEVLQYWQGLGYNRRAKFLHESAKRVVEQGKFPDDERGLTALPGVGKNTAGAILAYAYNQPSLFIETNVRAVYIHHYFNDQDVVDDRAIYDALEQTIDRDHPREFYWALMDYGSRLKKQGVKPSRSRHYKKQSPLKGSVREMRGRIIAALTAGEMTDKQLRLAVEADARYESAITTLMRDGLITKMGECLSLSK